MLAQKYCILFRLFELIKKNLSLNILLAFYKLLILCVLIGFGFL